MVEDFYLHRRGGKNQVAGNVFIAFTWFTNSGGVIVGKNQGNGIVCQCLLYYLPRQDGSAVNRTLDKVGGIDNLVLTGEVKNFEDFFLKIAH